MYNNEKFRARPPSLVILKRKQNYLIRFRLSGLVCRGRMFGFDSWIYSGGKKRGCAASNGASGIFKPTHVRHTSCINVWSILSQWWCCHTKTNKVSWSWHKCRRPTATSVAPYAVVVTVSGGPLFRNKNKAALFRADSSVLRPWTGYGVQAWGLPHCMTTTTLEFIGVLDLLVVMSVQHARLRAIILS